MAKSLLKLEARKLRTQGLGIKTIAHQLKVSSSTVSIWSKDILLSPDQIATLERNSKDPLYGKRLEYSLKQRSAKEEKIKKIELEALNTIGKLSSREKLIVGIALYWAEGFKKDNLAGFANTDPEMVKFILSWIIQSLNIPTEQIKLRIGLNESHISRIQEVETYWSNVTGIPLSQFQKPFFQKVAWKKSYEHPEDYFGTIRIRIAKSTDLLRLIKGCIRAISVSRPRYISE